MEGRCIECGAAVPLGEPFCSDNCRDIFNYPQPSAGRCIVQEVACSTVARPGDGGRREPLPPSAALPGDPVDFDQLPF